MLYRMYSEKLARDVRRDVQEEAERSTAQPWEYDLEAFRGGMAQEELQSLFQQTGHSPKCLGDTHLSSRINADDTSACWVVTGSVWGVPALRTAFAFGQKGLRNQVLHFPETSWPQVEKKLDAMGQRLTQTFGLDPETGGPIIGWRMNSGLAFSAPPPKGQLVSILWTAKLDLAEQHCPYQGTAARSDPHGYVVNIKRLWPEIDCSRLP